MAAPPPLLKKSYKCVSAVQLFYTGGPARLAPDASFVACACSDQVKIVDVACGSVRSTLEGDSELVTAIAITPDGLSLFTASRSRQIKLWTILSGVCVRTWKAHDGPVADMAVDASGGLLATAGADRAVLVWDIDHGYCTHAFRGHEGVVTTVIFHPDRRRLLLFSGSDDATVRIWDLMKKKCLAVLRKHFSSITSLAISQSSNKLMSSSRDKVVNVWDLEDYSLQTTVPIYEAIESVCIVPVNSKLARVSHRNKLKKSRNGESGDFFLTVGEKGNIRIWNSESAASLYDQNLSDAGGEEEAKGGFTGAVLLPSGEGVMCVTSDQRLLFYDVVESDSGDFALQINKRLIGNNEEVIDVKFVAGDKNLLAVATNVEQIRVYDTVTLNCKQELFGHKNIVLCLDSCLSPFQTAWLASGGKDNTIRVWDMERCSTIAIAEGHMASVGALAFSRKTKKFLVSGSSDHTIKVWSLEGLTEASVLEGPKKLFSQSTVAAHDKDINSIAVAPNDSLVCSGSQDRTACVWRLPELVPVVTLRGHKRGIWSVQFSPVDQCVMTASGDKTIRIWALSDGSCLKTFEGHTASVLRASFLTRGTQIISAGADGLLKLWTIKTNDCVNTFDQHEDKIWALDVNKDEMLATGGSDSLVSLWSDCTEADEQEAIRKEEEEILKDQDLLNALAETDYARAVQLAFELRRPFKMLSVFQQLFSQDKTLLKVHNVLRGMDKAHLRLLLEYIREWNCKPKFCHVAQCVLLELFLVLPPKDFIELPGIGELIEGILPYTQRHYSRIDRLLTSTFLLDYILSCMSVLNPVGLESTNVSEPAHSMLSHEADNKPAVSLETSRSFSDRENSTDELVSTEITNKEALNKASKKKRKRRELLGKATDNQQQQEEPEMGSTHAKRAKKGKKQKKVLTKKVKG